MNVGNMAGALKARDAGMASSANHAETDAPGWCDRAYQAVSAHMKWDCDWTIEEARAYLYAKNLLDEPTSLRAWGGVTQRLVRDGKIERVGFLPAASSNGSWKPTYRLTGG